MIEVVIIEDEVIAFKRLKRELNEYDKSITVLANLSSVEQAINWFAENNAPDLIFMDIQLEDGICFEIFEKIQIQTPIIFTTAFDTYAIEAFKVNSVDYLLKPVSSVQLQNAINKFKSFHSKNDIPDFENLIQSLKPKTKERFLLKIGDHFKSVPTTAINCFYINEKCNFVKTNTGKTYAIDYSLDKIELLIDNKLFFRVNRNCIVNISAIDDMLVYSSSRLKLNIKNWSKSDEIIVSRERAVEFKEWMNR